MRFDIAQKAASLVERIEDLESVILHLEGMREGKSYKLSTVTLNPKHGAEELEFEFKEGKLSTEIFQQNIIEYTINNFNVEMEELKQELDDLK